MIYRAAATTYYGSKIYQAQDEMQKETQKYLEIKEQQELARHVSKKDTQPVNSLLVSATKAVILDHLDSRYTSLGNGMSRAL
ncbi:hypothetical protein [Sporolactobacillus sp. THM19-2]|uniref:hypothetical protein n=1 Tax=Sporolactobacillus sp. THM19-2 TaxID=2511171 RepID=UPI001021F99D|nr:hypothetical protein [Sporolactobacillus sp. THM19-2]RYL93928.1 hypothetical protein EWH91_01895 [Sporolactobacillus sp. THM19-2]